MSAVLWVVATIGLGMNSFAPALPLPSGEEFADATPERKIAIMDARGSVSVLDPRVIRARAVLDRVGGLYFDDEERMVDLTEQLWRGLNEKGRRVTATEILEGAAAWAEAQPEGRRRRFSRVVTMYASARERGMSHAEALAALKEAAQFFPRGWRGW